MKHFFMLPYDLQDAVRDGDMPFDEAMELAGLAEGMEDEYGEIDPMAAMMFATGGDVDPDMMMGLMPPGGGMYDPPGRYYWKLRFKVYCYFCSIDSKLIKKHTFYALANDEDDDAIASTKVGK
jgi:hypothetical protein